MENKPDNSGLFGIRCHAVIDTVVRSFSCKRLA